MTLNYYTVLLVGKLVLGENDINHIITSKSNIFFFYNIKAIFSVIYISYFFIGIFHIDLIQMILIKKNSNNDIIIYLIIFISF